MFRKISLLFDAAGSRTASIAKYVDNFGAYGDPIEEGAHITSISAARQEVTDIIGEMLDAKGIPAMQKRLVRRFDDELDDLIEDRQDEGRAHVASDKASIPAGKQDDVEENMQKHFVFRALAEHTAHLAGIAEHYAKKDPTGYIGTLQDDSEMLWKTLANSATSSRIAALYHTGGMDHVIEETGMSEEDATAELSDWPGTGVGAETERAGGWKDRQESRSHAAPGTGRKASENVFSLDLERERYEAIQHYGSMNPNRQQLNQALRRDILTALNKEFTQTPDAGNTDRIRKSIAKAEEISHGDPISGMGAALAGRLVENNIVTNPESRKYLLGLAYLTERFHTREENAINAQVKSWNPASADPATIVNKARNLNLGILDTLTKTLPKEDRMSALALKKRMFSKEAKEMTLEDSLRVTDKISTLIDPDKTEQYRSIQIARRATNQALQARVRSTSEQRKPDFEQPDRTEKRAYIR